MEMGLDRSWWILRQSKPIFLSVFEAFAQADRHSRPTGTLMRSGNRQTMMKLHYCKMSSSKHVAKMEMLLDNSRSRS